MLHGGYCDVSCESGYEAMGILQCLQGTLAKVPTCVLLGVATEKVTYTFPLFPPPPKQHPILRCVLQLIVLLRCG